MHGESVATVDAFVTDDTIADHAGRTLVDALPAGSHVVLCTTNDFMPGEQVEGIAVADRGTRVDFRFRTREQILAFVDGLDLVAPGIVSTAEWRPEQSGQPLPARGDTAGWCLVARKR